MNSTKIKQTVLAWVTAPRFSTKERIFFIKRLNFLLAANVPLSEALFMLSEQAKTHSYGTIVSTLATEISDGKSFAKSLSSFPRFFDSFAVNLVAVGETSGLLAENLQYLAEELAKREQLRRNVLGALMYPLVIVFLTLSITLFLTSYLFPKIMPVFISLQVTLPVSTRIMIAVSSFLQKFGLLTGIFSLLATLGIIYIYVRNARFRLYVEQVILRTPVVKQLVQSYLLSQTARSLGLMLTSGVALPEACQMLGDTASHQVAKLSLLNLARTVRTGKLVSETLCAWPVLYPELFTSMLSVGERTGSLPQTLLYLGSFYEQEVEDMTKNISVLVEPVLMIVMGLLVGFIAVSIITPIYGLTEHLHA